MPAVQNPPGKQHLDEEREDPHNVDPVNPGTIGNLKHLAHRTEEARGGKANDDGDKDSDVVKSVVQGAEELPTKAKTAMSKKVAPYSLLPRQSPTPVALVTVPVSATDLP
jgi:hypothetical protein